MGNCLKFKYQEGKIICQDDNSVLSGDDAALMLSALFKLRDTAIELKRTFRIEIRRTETLITVLKNRVEEATEIIGNIETQEAKDFLLKISRDEI